jgi:dihydrofolate reductase
MINALFAVDHYGGMGFNGTLPWPHNAADLARFQKLTMGHVVVMGRGTYDDPKMPKPLEGRTVYVATNRPVNYGVGIKGDLAQQVLKIEQHHADKIIWVIGGANVLEQCADIFDNIYLTHFKGSYKIDTKINLKSILLGWQPVRADVATDFQSTMVKYANIFKRSTTGPDSGQ